MTHTTGQNNIFEALKTALQGKTYTAGQNSIIFEALKTYTAGQNSIFQALQHTQQCRTAHFRQ